MRIPIPFGYEATVWTASNRQVDRRYREIVEVEIPEFAAGDLPAVMTWRGSRPAHGLPAEHRVEALAHAGGLYEPVTESVWRDGEYRAAPVMADDVARAIEQAVEKVGLGAPAITTVFSQSFARDAFRDVDPFNHKGPPKKGTVVETGRDKEISKALACAGQFLSLDGRLYERVPEPVLWAGPHGVAVLHDLPQDEGTPRRNLFRLDEGDAARRRAAIVGDGKAVPDLVLHRPDLLTRDLSGLTLYAAVRAALEEAARRLATAPMAALEAFCDLKEALYPPRTDDYRPAPDTPPAELARAGIALCDAFSGEGVQVMHECRDVFGRVPSRDLEAEPEPSGFRP